MRWIVFFFLLVFWGCKKKEESPASTYRPVMMKREDLEKSVTFTSETKRIKRSGKIYTLGNFIFIVDQYKGVHVVDNTNPSSPTIKGFINVPGCVDVAAKGNYLYVDNATDLVTIDVTDPMAPVVADRERDVFPDLIPPDFTTLPDVYSKSQRPANTVIVSWE